MFSQRTFDKDFYLDRVILHRIQRVKQAEDANDMDVESDGGGDDELPSD